MILYHASKEVVEFPEMRSLLNCTTPYTRRPIPVSTSTNI